jgi:hypothetical protein
MFYIVSSSGDVVASASGPVNTGDLARSGSTVVSSDLTLRPDEVSVKGFPEEPRIVVADPKPPAATLTLSSTATDDDGDGIPELRANGKDNTTITVDASLPDGKPVVDPVSITFRTTAGRLSARVVDLEDGKATVQLTAGRETVAVTVTAQAPGFADALLQLEFVP